MNNRKILSVGGLISSGKDTVADYLIANHGFKRMSYASSLKDAVSAIFGWDRDLLEGSTKESRTWREEVDTWWASRLNMPHLTPRYVLQHIGTEVFRNNFHDDMWIASLEYRLLQVNSNVVITDCRFVNELESIKKVGGTTIRINRGDPPEWVNVVRSDFSLFKSLYPKIHASEYSGVLLNYDHYIENNDTLDGLYSKIEKIVSQL